MLWLVNKLNNLIWIWIHHEAPEWWVFPDVWSWPQWWVYIDELNNYYVDELGNYYDDWI